ncbi:YqcC family protein [Marinobacter caseinilyticus]|uniref:YqcC family protein n=1 Tax=Marinobacter caseinilyticus TaxID=2692195 RepID=UPI00140B177E|nr:YqcC family protein [Marinobacter caseinilyticus]
MQNVDEVADSLLRIEAELRRLSVWATETPMPSALQSDKPFCVDTLEFTEWLQFIFLPKMKVLVEQGRTLPQVSGMAPMAEEYFQARRHSGGALVQELKLMDRLLSGK